MWECSVSYAQVVHDVFEALVLLADEVLDGHLHVLEGDVSGARGPHAGALHLAGGDAGHVALDEQHRDAAHARAAGAHGDAEVVGEDTVGNPPEEVQRQRGDDAGERVSE